MKLQSQDPTPWVAWGVRYPSQRGSTYYEPRTDMVNPILASLRQLSRRRNGAGYLDEFLTELAGEIGNDFTGAALEGWACEWHEGSTESRWVPLHPGGEARHEFAVNQAIKVLNKLKALRAPGTP